MSAARSSAAVVALLLGAVAASFSLPSCAGAGAPPPEPERPAAAPAVGEVRPPVQPPETPPSDEDALHPFDGRYEIARTLEHDGCGGAIVGRARVLVVDASRRLLHTDSVEDGYPARVDGGELVAERRFAEDACPDSTHYARWRLTRAPDGALDGTVESQWLLPPECASPCVVRFRIHATPLQ